MINQQHSDPNDPKQRNDWLGSLVRRTIVSPSEERKRGQTVSEPSDHGAAPGLLKSSPSDALCLSTAQQHRGIWPGPASDWLTFIAEGRPIHSERGEEEEEGRRRRRADGGGSVGWKEKR